MTLYIAKLIHPLVLEHALSSAEEIEVIRAVAKVREFLDDQAAYTTLTRNFEELEKFFQDTDREIAQSTTLRSAWRIDVMMLEVNRLAMNFMSSARSYIDLTDRRMRDRSEQLQTKYRIWKSEQYDASVAYRIAENLRNVAQHKGLPIRAYRSSSERQANGEIVKSHSIMIDRSSLINDKKVQGAVRAELAKEEGNIPVAPIFSEYIERLGTVQLQVLRETIPEYLAPAQFVSMLVHRLGDPAKEPIGFASCTENQGDLKVNFIDAHMHVVHLILNTNGIIGTKRFYITR